MSANPLADLRRRLRQAGLSGIVHPVSAHVNRDNGASTFGLVAPSPIGPDEKKRIADVMGSAWYVIDTRRFSDGYRSETR